MFKSDSSAFMQNYCAKVLVPAVKKIKPAYMSVEFDGMTGTVEFNQGSLTILATPFYEGCEGLPIEIRDAKGEEILTVLRDISLSGNPEDDAEKYLNTVLETLKSVQSD